MTYQANAQKLAALRRLSRLGGKAGLLDVTHLCGAQAVKAMAANGFVKVEVTITPKGTEFLLAELRRTERREAAGPRINRATLKRLGIECVSERGKIPASLKRRALELLAQFDAKREAA